MTDQPQEKPPAPGHRLSHLLWRSRCERCLLTTAVFGPYPSPGEDVSPPPALHVSGTSQQDPLAPAPFADMTAVE